MFVIVVAMLVIVAVASLVVGYVAYPHRGLELPHAKRLGEAMKRGVDSMPTVDHYESTARR